MNNIFIVAMEILELLIIKVIEFFFIVGAIYTALRLYDKRKSKN